jgi:3,4-dihydroxy 2-butanone 4-phosphate synthase / GTP cyclohydrolase II
LIDGCQNDLKVKSVSLMTNNPLKKDGLEKYGIKVCSYVPIELEPNEFNKNYMKTKMEKMGHLLTKIE